MGHPTVYVETWTTLAQDSLAAPMFAQESSILWPQRNRWSGVKKSGLGVQRNPLSSHGTAHRLCRVRRPWQIGGGEKIKNIKEIPSAPFPPRFCAHSRREGACSATLHWRALVFLKGSPARQPESYSLAYLVVPNTEEQFSQPFLGLSKIWQLFQDPIII